MKIRNVSVENIFFRSTNVPILTTYVIDKNQSSCYVSFQNQFWSKIFSLSFFIGIYSKKLYNSYPSTRKYDNAKHFRQIKQKGEKEMEREEFRHNCRENRN